MASNMDGNTVHLTEQEAARIKTTVKDRIEKCSSLTGQGRKPTEDGQSAIGEANNTALMAEMGSMAFGETKNDKLPALAVGDAYPPSITALRDLQPITLSDLRMDTHHHGRRLTVKRVSLVVTHAARSWTVVQDEAGDEMERLEIYLHKLNHGKEALESASLFIIKEPYFTLSDQGEPTLRIDHPSDLVVCRDEIVPSELVDGGEVSGLDPAEAEKSARTRKDDGNTALKKQNLALAHANYTAGLKIAQLPSVSNTAPDLARDIHRNRALANLLLGQLDEAKADAKASLINRGDPASDDLDSKAYSRAGSAAYNLGQYEEAKGFFENQLKLAPGDKTAPVNLRRVALRLREQETGTYNLNRIQAGLSRDRPLADAATFLGYTAIKDSPGRGRGLFATRDIPAGDIILCEKAFCVAWGHDKDALTAMTYDTRDDRIRVSPAGLTRSLVQKLLCNPSQIENVMNLYGDYDGSGKSIAQTEDGPIVDVFRAHDIVSRNAFGLGALYGASGPASTSTGLWVRAAYINHSCLPNATKSFVGDLMIVRAVEPIAAGEEIFHSYSVLGDYDARQAALMTTWGFECSCALCAGERGDDAGLRARRMELAGEADAFVEREPWARAKRLTIAKGQRLARAIDETYDGERYEGVPHVAAYTIREWLARAEQRR